MQQCRKIYVGRDTYSQLDLVRGRERLGDSMLGLVLDVIVDRDLGVRRIDRDSRA